MEVQHFLKHIEAAGFTLEPHGDFGISVMPFSRLSDTQRQFIKAHKSALRAALMARENPPIFDDQEEADILAHPDRYEIIEFTRWRLPSGRCVAFKLAIPKEKYDGFELLRLLEIQGRQLTGTPMFEEG